MDRKFDENKAKEALENGYKDAEKVLKDPKEIDRLLMRAEKRIKSIPLVGEKLADIPVMISVLKNYKDKKYTDIPLVSIISIISALLYFVSPIDIIPDTIPGIGYIDDIAVVAMCMNAIEKDMKKYLAWCKENGLILEEEVIKNNIDYEDIINQFEESTYRFLLANVYDKLDFKVISLENVRRMDLEEKVIALSDGVYVGDVANNSTLVAFLNIVGTLFDKKNLVEDNSKAVRYVERATNIIKRTKDNEDISLNDVEDVLLILLGIYRQRIINDNSKLVKKIDNLNMTVNIDDLNLIDEIVSEYLDYDKIKKLKLINKDFKDDSTKEMVGNLLIINMMIYICRALETRGKLNFLNEG